MVSLLPAAAKVIDQHGEWIMNSFEKHHAKNLLNRPSKSTSAPLNAVKNQQPQPLPFPAFPATPPTLRPIPIPSIAALGTSTPPSKITRSKATSALHNSDEEGEEVLSFTPRKRPPAVGGVASRSESPVAASSFLPGPFDFFSHPHTPSLSHASASPPFSGSDEERSSLRLLASPTSTTSPPTTAASSTMSTTNRLGEGQHLITPAEHALKYHSTSSASSRVPTPVIPDLVSSREEGVGLGLTSTTVEMISDGMPVTNDGTTVATATAAPVRGGMNTRQLMKNRRAEVVRGISSNRGGDNDL